MSQRLISPMLAVEVHFLARRFYRVRLSRKLGCCIECCRKTNAFYDFRSDIATCQAAGKVILLSLGGATGTYGFSSASEASTFATTLWDTFGGGSSSSRPFGSSIVDGFDLDIENNEPMYYDTLVTSLRTLYSQDASKSYYITGAPQCPYPDASLGTALSNAPFDMVFVQFYNNPCGVSTPSSFNFGTWDSWAKSSPNPNVKVFIGVPAAPSAANAGFYITPDALDSIVASVKGTYSSLGGIMMWDASQSSANIVNGNTYAQNAKAALGGASSSSGGTASASSAVATSQISSAVTSANTGISIPTAQTHSSSVNISPTGVSYTTTSIRVSSSSSSLSSSSYQKISSTTSEAEAATTDADALASQSQSATSSQQGSAAVQPTESAVATTAIQPTGSAVATIAAAAGASNSVVYATSKVTNVITRVSTIGGYSTQIVEEQYYTLVPGPDGTYDMSGVPTGLIDASELASISAEAG